MPLESPTPPPPEREKRADGGGPVAEPESLPHALERAFGWTERDRLVLCGLGLLLTALTAIHVWRIKGNDLRPVPVQQAPREQTPEPSPVEPPTWSPPENRTAAAADPVPSPNDRETRTVRRPTLYLVDINRAEWIDFAELPGVGDVLARRIIAHRDRVGPFDSIEHLLQVPGVGKKTLEKMRPHLVRTAD